MKHDGHFQDRAGGTIIEGEDGTVPGRFCDQGPLQGPHLADQLQYSPSQADFGPERRGEFS